MKKIGTKKSNHDFYEDFIEDLHRITDYDFSNYAKESLFRRIDLSLHHFNIIDPQSLINLLQQKPEILPVILKKLTVNTTEFFRDIEYFKYFQKEIVPFLDTFTAPVIWIAGCSTGEEVLSMLVILDMLGMLKKVRIHATDINPFNLTHAKIGKYRIEQMSNFNKNFNHLFPNYDANKYYDVTKTEIIFKKFLYQNLLFSEHNLAVDQSFAECHFISCRYVFIYFNRFLKDHCIEIFNQSLVSKGFLGFGQSEVISNLDSISNYTKTNDLQIFRKKKLRINNEI